MYPATIPGHAVRVGDVLHEHGDATVTEFTPPTPPDVVCEARIRYPHGDTGIVYFGTKAAMSVTRPEYVQVECPRCPVCKEQSTVMVTDEGYMRWAGGELIQNAFPELDVDTRELLISGTHKDCWDALLDEDGFEEAL